MKRVVLAYAEADEGAADRLAAAFTAKGFLVEMAGLSAKAGAGPADLVLVWSRRSAAAPALRRSALAAKAAGRLVIARLDDAAPPPSLRTRRTVALRGRAVAERDFERLFPSTVTTATSVVDAPPPPVETIAAQESVDVRFPLLARIVVLALSLAALGGVMAAMGGPF
jgi:hypothetical protein